MSMLGKSSSRSAETPETLCSQTPRSETPDTLPDLDGLTSEDIAGRLSCTDDTPAIAPDGWIATMSFNDTKKQSIRAFIRIIFTGLELQILISVIVIADCAVFIWHVVLDQSDELSEDVQRRFAIFEWFVLAFCALETLGRLIGFGFWAYIRDPWNLFDATIVILAIVFATTIVAMKTAKLLRIIRKIVWGARFGRLLCQGRKMKASVKKKVSQNKARFVDLADNFDLDLTYITGTVIAMGMPTASCLLSFYRNPLSDVVRFFKTKHPDNFRIYNACPEYPYPDTGFVEAGGQVVHFQIQDHTPPTMNQFVEFLTDAQEFRKGNKTAVLAVHCKGGKGRTGSLITAWLMFNRRLKPKLALHFFARRRTDEYVDKKLAGVETPSQVRYIYQLSKHLEATGRDTASPPSPLGNPTWITLNSLDFEGGLIARPAKMGRLKVLVQCGGVNISDLVLETDYFQADVTSIPLNAAGVGGDVRISVFAEKGLKGATALDAIKSASNSYDAKGIQLFFLFHTDFLDLTLSEEKVKPGKFRIGVEHLDKAHKKVKKGKHAAGSSAVLHYSMTQPQKDPEELEPGASSDVRK